MNPKIQQVRKYIFNENDDDKNLSLSLSDVEHSKKMMIVWLKTN